MGGNGGSTTTIVGEGLVIVAEDEFIVFVFHIDNQILCFCALSFGIEFKGIWITSLADIQKSRFDKIIFLYVVPRTTVLYAFQPGFTSISALPGVSKIFATN